MVSKFAAERTLAANVGESALALEQMASRRDVTFSAARGSLARSLKRAVDIVASIAGLVVLAPLLLVIAVAVKLDSRGPVLFAQTRHGLGRKTFVLYKFRSMTDARTGAPEITRIGRVLRASNLDELPQLWNVLTGSMSLVGPRPHPIPLDLAWQPRLAHYDLRYGIKPGITGWAQVNGHRGTITGVEAMRARLEHDLYYIENQNLLLDCRIIWRTLFSRKAYQNAG